MSTDDLLTDREPRVEMGGYWAHRDADGQWWVWGRDGKQWELCNPYGASTVAAYIREAAMTKVRRGAISWRRRGMEARFGVLRASVEKPMRWVGGEKEGA